MRPGQRFGRPAINGVATEAIWEHAEADESEAEIVEAFGLTIADVRYALSYETSARSKPAARAA
jgi:uncharacterized protein (DUF433 family)